MKDDDKPITRGEFRRYKASLEKRLEALAFALGRRFGDLRTELTRVGSTDEARRSIEEQLDAAYAKAEREAAE